MGFTTTIDLAPVAHGLTLPLEQVESVVRLLDAGNTVPFITRYRKDQTGGLDEEQIRQIQDQVGRVRMIAERKQTILRSIDSQGKLTPELAGRYRRPTASSGWKICTCRSSPRSKRWPRWPANGSWSRWPRRFWRRAIGGGFGYARGRLRQSGQQLKTVADVLLGVGHILAEDFSERADLRGRLRKIVKKSGQLVCAKTEIAEKQGKEFRDYFEFREPLGKIPPHRVLAINRGERAKVLRVKIESD